MGLETGSEYVRPGMLFNKANFSVFGTHQVDNMLEGLKQVLTDELAAGEEDSSVNKEMIYKEFKTLAIESVRPTASTHMDVHS